jgi:hypothetical protein
MNLPAVTMMLTAPVLLSVRRLLRVPMFHLSVLLPRAAAPLLVLLCPLRSALTLPRLVALGLLLCAPLVRLLHVMPIVPFRVGLGVGVRVLMCGGL